MPSGKPRSRDEMEALDMLHSLVAAEQYSG